MSKAQKRELEIVKQGSLAIYVSVSTVSVVCLEGGRVKTPPQGVLYSTEFLLYWRRPKSLVCLTNRNN